VIDLCRREVEDLRNSDKDPIDFAIEAMRLNIVVACFKDETILHEAMIRLQEYKAKNPEKEL